MLACSHPLLLLRRAEWAGTYCTEPGAICEGPYECKNNGYCIAFRKCLCSGDWEGDQCEKAACAPGCSDVGGYCDNAPGTCLCRDKHSGVFCTDCVDGYYPRDSDGKCVVKQTAGYCDGTDGGATYNPTSGICDCTPLKFLGERCDRPCPKCPSGFRVTGGCTNSKPNPVCGACSGCQDGVTYAAAGCDGGTLDTICALCTPCQAGTFYAGGCAGGEDSICQSTRGVPEGA